MKNLQKIQNELKVPKGNFNSFGKYKYRSAEDILEALKPILNKHNSVVLLSDEILPIGVKYFLKATANFISGEEKVSVSGFAELCEHKGMSAEQATGTASSYARKYALNGLFLIDETEADVDSGNFEQVKKNPIEQHLNTLNTLDELVAYQKELKFKDLFTQEVKDLFTKRKIKINGNRS